MEWCGIAPFEAPCKLAGGYLDSLERVSPKPPVTYIEVSGTCKACERPFTRRTTRGNKDRIIMCGRPECAKIRQRQRQRKSRAGRLGRG